MKPLEIYQALWAMEGYPSFDKPISLTETLVKTKQSGFAGILQYIDDFEEATVADTDEINASPLKLALSCRGYNIEDIEAKLKYAKEKKAEFINIMVMGYFIRGEKAINLLKEIQRLAKEIGVKTFIETHRGTITQDLNTTRDYIKAIDDLRLTIDLSHYVVAGEMDLTNDLIEEAFDEVLSRTGSIHVRVSNGQEIQLSMDTIVEEQLNNFKRWWNTGLDYASKLDNEETIPVVIELGPFPYQQRIYKDGWVYEGDRYEESVRWMDYFKALNN